MENSKRIKAILVVCTLTASVLLSGCGGSGKAASSAAGSSAAGSSVAASSAAASSSAASSEAVSNGTVTAKLDLEDGTYEAKFTTDNSMFHVNEAYDNKGTLTVKDGRGVLHVVLASKNVVNLFLGKADDAQKDGATILLGNAEKVKYKDGTEDEANAFDIPIPCIDKEFDCALVGTKGKWYDHKVKVSDVKKI